MVWIFLMMAALACAEVRVSPGANDSASLERARDSARGGVVVLHGGVYRLSRTLELGAADSGTTFRAAAGEVVRLSAGVVVAARPVTDAAVLARLDPAAKGKVAEIDGKALGLRHLGRFKDVFGDGGGIVQLYCDGKRLPVSRWPNRGYARMVRVTDNGDWSNGPGRHGGAFVYEGDRPSRWLKAVKEGLWLDGFWRVPWTPEKVRVQSIDVASKTITQAAPVGGGIGSKYKRPEGDGKEPWYALNVLEEIDQPGEWALDFQTGKIYLWPPSKGELVIADLETPLVRVAGASNVRFERVVFEGGLGDGVAVQGGEANVLAGCTFRWLGGNGVALAGGTRHGVQSCDFHGLGAGGVLMSGGDRKTLTPAGHYVVNSHFHHLGEVRKTYTPAVNIGYGGTPPVGMVVRNNLIHDLPHAAVLYAGNDHLLELNEVHNVALDSGDVGAFYTWNDWTSRGNMVRYNFVHHSSAANAFYMDDGDSGDTVTGNVVYRTQYGPFIGGGHDNTVRNNLVIEAKRGLHLDARGVPRHYDTSDKHKMNLLATANYRQPPWSVKYPELLKVLEHPTLPSGNALEENALVGCGEPYHFDKGDVLRFSTIRGNVTETVAGAGFVDAAKLDFRLKPGSELVKKLPRLGEIPFGKIGLYVDEYRRVLPETDRYTDRRETAAFDSDKDRKASERTGTDTH